MPANIQPIFPKTPHVESGTGDVSFTGTAEGSRVDTIVIFNNGGVANASAIQVKYGTTILRQLAIGELASKSYVEELIDKAIPSGGIIEVDSAADVNINVTIFGGDY